MVKTKNIYQKLESSREKSAQRVKRQKHILKQFEEKGVNFNQIKGMSVGDVKKISDDYNRVVRRRKWNVISVEQKDVREK